MSSEIREWVQTFQEEYLPTSKYEGDGALDDLLERALEAIECDLRHALQEAERDWWEEKCSVCGGEGICDDCTEGVNDEGEPCETCAGTGMCSHCEGTGLEHYEK